MRAKLRILAQDPPRDDLLGPPLTPDQAKFILDKIQGFAPLLRDVRDEVGKEVWGKEQIIDLMLLAMLANGHILTIGVPGVAKTTLVSRMSTVLSLRSKRVQFTPDMMPADITGSPILQETEKGKEFVFRPGPVFTQFLMADEINRAGPKTQSGLLEAMQERRVTVDGKTYDLPRPFLVMATQNPNGQEGTYPLTEASLDRFLMCINFGYDPAEAEKKMMVKTTSTPVDHVIAQFKKAEEGADLTQEPDVIQQSKLKPVFDKNTLILMQDVTRSLPLTEKFVDAVSTVVRSARPGEKADEFINEYVAVGPGPRAYQAFALAAKARAVMDGRIAPSIDDLIAVMDPVLEHRIVLNMNAHLAKKTYKDVRDHLIKKLRP